MWVFFFFGVTGSFIKQNKVTVYIMYSYLIMGQCLIVHFRFDFLFLIFFGKLLTRRTFFTLSIQGKMADYLN